jgi:signal peptidase I
MKQIFKVIYSLVVAFIVLVAVLLIVSILPITGNFKVLTVVSGSMEPAIKTGSVVIVKPAFDYKVGDVITFGPYTKTKAPTTHRIYSVKTVDGEPVYITKGDANNSPDAREVKKRDVLGKVLFSVPYVGYAVDFAKKPAGFALLILVPAAIIIGDEVKKIIKELRKKKVNG